MKRLMLFMILLGFYQMVAGQVQGFVLDEDGETLPYANVYVAGTSLGTASNPEGYFNLDLEDGSYEIVAEFLGYASQSLEVNVVNGRSDTLKFFLSPASFALGEVVVRADGEDPAYEIIRQAQARRAQHYAEVMPSQCDVYVKGLVKLLDAPESILGEDIGNLWGTLDSNRQGVIYLSETQSELIKLSPTEYKEVILKSVVAGSDMGVSYNRALATDYHIYDSYINFGREIPSPIGPSAFRFYRYQLLGSATMEGETIHQIRVIPRNEELAALVGEIYISDGNWRVSSLDFWISGSALNNEVVDSIRWQQNLIEVEDLGVFQRKSQNFFLYFNFFGFRGKGEFVNVYNNYRVPSLEGKDIKGEIVRFDKDYNQKDSSFWNQVRPIPLTAEERLDYVRKDSLKNVWESEEFLDSIDAESNEFGVSNIIGGYTYTNSYDQYSIQLLSPLTSVGFNAVQGVNVNLKARYLSWTDSTEWSIQPLVNYGFAQERLYYGVNFRHENQYNNDQAISVRAGRELLQYNPDDPFPEIFNTVSSLLFHRNYWRLYDAYNLELGLERRLGTSWDVSAAVDFELRDLVANNSDYSFFYKDRTYASNLPNNILYDTEVDSRLRRRLEYRLDLSWTPFRRYQTLPKYKIYGGSRFPTLTLAWRHGLPLGDSYSEYMHLQCGLGYDLNLNTWGSSGFLIQGGLFLDEGERHFADFKHFLGQETLVQPRRRSLASYYTLPFYASSTDGAYFQGHFEHQFEGYVLDRIPLLRKLGWHSVVGTNALWTEDHPYFHEVYIGIDNIGYKVFRILQLRLASTWIGGDYDSTVLRFSLSLPQ